MLRYRLSRRRARAEREQAIREVERIAANGRPIVVGPWTGDAGMELLYWIPFLRWLVTVGGVRPRQVLAISCGGADPWYADVSGGYVDLYDGHAISVVRRWSRERRDEGDLVGSRRHPLDEDVLRRARTLVGNREVDWLHPSLLTRLFAPRWEFGEAATVVAANSVQRPLPPDLDTHALTLPPDYAAVRVVFGPAFPDTPENRTTMEWAIRALAEQTPVVLLRAQEEPLGHQPYVPPPGLPVLDIVEHLTPRHALAIQSRVVRGAGAFLSTYCGLAFVGPYVGTPTVAVYSRAAFNVAHLDAIDRVGRRFQEGVQLFRARHAGSLRKLDSGA